MILSNTPTLSYIYIKDMVITYNDIPYQISNTYTQKPYIYWSIDQPYELIVSNSILKEKAGLYYICFNQKGNPTIVPQTDIEISFGEGSSRDLITEKILGFQEQNEINGEKFTTIQADINGIKQTVGTVQEDVNGAKQTISEVNQKADNISASVSTLEREYTYNQELSALREDTNIALLGLQSTLGTFSSDMNNFMEDNKLSDEESNQINVYKDIMATKLGDLNTQIDKIITLLETQEKTEDVTRLTTQKQLLNDSINNLLTNITTVCADKVFTNTEITTVVSYFANANTKINETNNMIDELIFLETGGALIEEISKLNISQNEIKLSVSKNEQTTTEMINNKIDEIGIGGRNYIYFGRGNNNKGMFSDNKWTITDDYAEATLSSANTYNSIYIFNGFILKAREYEVGEQYTWSYDFMITDWTMPEGTNIGEWWMGQRYTNGTSESSEGAWRPVTQHNLPRVGENGVELNKWVHATYTVTIPEQAHSSIGTASSIQFYQSNANVTGSITFRIKNVKIEKGNKATDWTPSPEDIQAQIDSNKTEIQATKETVAEHTTSLNGITSRVSSTEANITTIQNKINTAIKEVYTMYYLSTSSTQLIDGAWSRDIPSDISYNYLWTKTVTVYIDDTTSESDPICNTAISGEDGEPGYTVILSDETFIVQCDLSGNPL